MNHLKTLLICALWLSSVVAFSQEQNSVLWKISGNGLQSPSYLFGTIHIICPDELELSPKVLEALNKSQQLILELDMDEPTFIQEMQQLSINSDMRNLSSLLSEQDIESLNSFFMSNYQADMSQLGILKPFALLSMMFIKGLDCPQPGSFEQLLLTYAEAKNWDVSGLETIQEQIDVFEQVSEIEQMNWLVNYAKNEKEFKAGLAKLVEAYQKEEIVKILDLMTEYPEYKNIEDALLYERNEKWIEKFVKNASDKSTFFAVGAAHLGSDMGLVELLRKEGFVLTPIMD
jgi:uncharacterized protein YbaP (TraB family)